MSDVPTIALGDKKSAYDKDAGKYTQYIPVKIRVADREEAREVAKVFTQAWKDKHGDGDE